MKAHELAAGAPLKIALLVGASILLSAGSVPGRAPPPGRSSRVDAIKQRGTLRVAVLDEYPWLKQTAPGSPEPFAGPAWLIAKETARRLGVQLQTVPVDFANKTAVLSDGRADLTIAPLLGTPERQRALGYIPYSMAAHCVFGRADNPKVARAARLDDLDRPDITIGIIAGSPQGAWLHQRLPRAQSDAIPGSLADLATDEVLTGRADVAPIDKFFFTGLARRVPGLVTVPKGDACMASTELSVPIGMAVQIGDPALLEWLRRVVNELRPQVEAEQARILAEGP